MDQVGSPGGGGGRPGVDALAAPDYGAYMAELQRRIKRNWRPPSAQEDKRVVVRFTIGRDGRLMTLALQRSSGYSEADQAALSAIKLSAPFRPLPAGHREDDLPIEFTFDYNVYRSGGGLSFR
jgi:TonB family protein